MAPEQNSMTEGSSILFDISSTSSPSWSPTSSSAISADTSFDSLVETNRLIPFPSIATGIQQLINKYNSDKGRHRRITGPDVKPAKFAVIPALLKKPSPVLNLVGTVKLHGVHIDLVFDLAGVKVNKFPVTGPQLSPQQRKFRIQSRNVASINETNDIFEVAKRLRNPKMHGSIFSLRDQFLAAFRKRNPTVPIDSTQPLIIAGEWVGPDVQLGVALSQFPEKAFVILNFSVNGAWVPSMEPYAHINSNRVGIFNICLGGFFRVAVKVDEPEAGFSEVKSLTLGVEAECPFAKAVGEQILQGRVISGVGEGIVWCVESVSTNPKLPTWKQQLAFDPRYWAKTKGPLHTEVDATKLPVPFNPDAIASAQAFAAATVTEARLEKKWVDMLQLFPGGFGAPQTGKFMELLHKDIEKEESEEIKVRGINLVEAKKAIMALGKVWFKRKLEDGKLLESGKK